MKKSAFFTAALLSCLCLTVQAQVGVQSVESMVTFGNFTNVLDSAATINDAVTDIPFNQIGKSYFFGGIAGNPQEMIIQQNVVGTVIAGYYHAGKLPWSIFASANYTGHAPFAPLTVNDGSGTTTKYQYPGFETLNTSLQFLMAFEKISTGLFAQLNFADSANPANNYDRTTSGLIIKNRENALTSDLNFGIPLFFTTGKLQHYAVISTGINLDDKSRKTITTTGGSTVTQKLDNVETIISPNIAYNLFMPLGPNGNQIAFSINPGVNIPVYSNKFTDSSGLSPDTVTTRDYVAGCSLDASVGYAMNFYPTGDWLKFSMYPQIAYSFSSQPYYTSETTAGTKLVNRKESSLVNNITATLGAGIEFRPPNWIFGFMLGSQITVEFQNTTNENNAGNFEGDPMNPTTQTVTNAWTTGVAGNIGVYIPLPDNFRLDFAVLSAANNLFEFGSLSIQLIVPLK